MPHLPASRRLLAAAASAALLAVPSTASAQAEVEPNDSVDTQQVLVDGAQWTGVLGTRDDKDAWRINVGPGTHQVAVTAENTSAPDTGSFILGLTDEDGELVDSYGGVEGVIGPGDSARVAYTFTGPTTAYVYTSFYCEMGYCAFTDPGNTSYRLTASAPTPPAVPCAAERQSVTRTRTSVSKARSAYRRNRSARNRSKLRTAKRRYAAAKRAYARCS